ncbi:MAG: hypothetical protein ABJH69_14195 [Crocinitomicaceae bacterium]
MGNINYECFVRYVETEKVIVGLRKDQILQIYFKSELTVDLETQHWLIIVYNYVTDEKEMPAILEGGEFVRIRKEAAAYAIKAQNWIPINSNAIVVKNTAQYITARFFIKFMKTGFPMKTFKTFDTALAWSKEQRLP